MDNNPGVSDLPARLFHGNPHLDDISMRGNGFTTLAAAQFPLDRLSRLQLSENPFTCNCSLLWLWRLMQEEERARAVPTQPSALHSWTTDFWGDWDFLDSEDDEEFWTGERFSWSSGGGGGGNAAAAGPSSSSLVIVDRSEIGCDVVGRGVPGQRVRRQLLNLEAGDIECPTQMLTIICAILTIFLVLVTCFSILFYLQFMRRRKKVLEERKNVNERIVPQHVNKLDLERYLTGQQVLHPPQTTATAPLPPTATLMGTMYQQQQQHQHANLFGGGNTLQQNPSSQQQPTNLNDYHQHKPSWEVKFPPPPAVLPPPLMAAADAGLLVVTDGPASDHNYHVEGRGSPFNDFNYHTTKSQFSPQKKFNFLPHQNSHPQQQQQQLHHRTLHHEPHNYLQKHQQQQQQHQTQLRHPNRYHNHLLLQQQQPAMPHENGTATLGNGGGGVGFNKKFLFATTANSSSSSSSSSSTATAANPHENLINNDTDTDHYEQFEYLDCRPNKHLPLQRHHAKGGGGGGGDMDQPHVVYV